MQWLHLTNANAVFNKTECPREFLLIMHLKVVTSDFIRIENYNLRNNVLYIGLTAAF